MGARRLFVAAICCFLLLAPPVPGQSVGEYGFRVDVPCSLTMEKELTGSETAKIAPGRVEEWISFSCITGGREAGEGTIYRVVSIRHDTEVDPDVETYAKESCGRNEEQDMQTEVGAWKGRPACYSREQAYSRDKVFESGPIDFRAGRRSYTLNVFPSAGSLDTRLNRFKRSFQLD
jgi:hypothetical protein